MAMSELSKRSSIPPCPGRMLPESFMPSWRFISDSTRSPHVPNTTTTTDKRANAVCTCVACPQKDEDGKEIEMKSICHLDSMDFYNKQYYKLIAILRTIG